MVTELTHSDLVAALEWQLELGADEALQDNPIDRFSLAAGAPKVSDWLTKTTPKPAASVTPLPISPAGDAPADDAVAQAGHAAGSATSLEDLREALAAYPHCELKKGARTLVFSDGNPAARVMVIGEAPGAEEDRQGKPFVGRAGQLLDRMFAAIGLARDAVDAEKALYITNILPWRPPQNRDPKPEEIAMLRPFLERHVDLAGPDMLVLMGNHACHALLGRRGITRLRGTWTEALGRPALPMFHPAYLLRNPFQKRETWADLLELNAKLAGRP